MGLMKNAGEVEVRERYQNIINQKEGWHEDIASFMYDCFTELRQKLNLINRTLYKMFFFLPVPLIFIGIILLALGASKIADMHLDGTDFVRTFGVASKVLVSFGVIVMAAGIALILTGVIKLNLLKQKLSYLDRLVRFSGSKVALEYDEKKLDALVRLYLKDGRSMMVTSMGNSGVYINNGGMDRYRNNYNPVMTQQAQDVVALSDIMQEIVWVKLFDMYNSLYRSGLNSMRDGFNR